MNNKKSMLFLCLVFFIGSTLLAQDYQYIGAAKCKMCHNKPTTGQQYKKWSELKHSKAMESLSSQASLDYAKKNNIADPTKDAGCLKCHSTLGSIDKSLNMGLTINEGVSCETCHGAGSKYKAMPIMKSREKSIANGLIIPDENLCKKCHNKENPFYKPFDYASAVKKIAHPIPEDDF
ncbi:cytochrome c family protein [Bacteroidota bacterium]